MRLRGSAVVLTMAMLAACSSGGGGALGSSSGAASGAAACDGTGVTYDVAKSKFAFGGTPTQEVAGDLTRWIGPEGVLVIAHDGSVMANVNAQSPERDVPDWSDDPDALIAHVRAYFASLGVPDCEIGRTWINGGSNGRAVSLERRIDGILVGASRAYARFDRNDVTTLEGFYWPALPADVVAAGRAFRDRLADPASLAAYRAKLPANAQGDGEVAFHHTSRPIPKTTFRAIATWDVMPSDGGTSAAPVSFDENGAKVDVGLW